MRMPALLLAVGLLTACSAPASESTATSISTGRPQETVTGTLHVDGRDRSFRVSTPDGFHRGQRWPVIVAFHGWGETGATMAEMTRLDRARAIVVFPDGIDKAWAPAPYATTTAEEDLDFVRSLVAHIGDSYPVDHTRIFATGFSNGGGFAAYLGCQLPQTFHAVAPVGAAYYEAIHADCTDLPVARLDIHGTHDTTIGYHGGTRHGTRYESIQQVLEGVADRNGCTGTTITRDGQDVVVHHWQGCELPLVHMRVGGGSHVWPADATAEVRSFFGV